MPAIPNPFLNSADEVMLSAETAVASMPTSPESDAAAEPIAGPNPVTSALIDLSLDDTDDIPELLYRASKLMRDRRFVLDESRFLAEIDEPPLFLRDVRHASR